MPRRETPLRFCQLPRFRMRRNVRRLSIAATVVGFAVFSATYVKNVVYDTLHPPSAAAEVIVITQAPTTVTQTVFVTSQPTVTLTHAPPVEARSGDDDLQPHEYRLDGLLEVNPNGSHPIFELMERAEAEWTNKLGRASKTLDEAVTEYQRRYSRMPPRGFDDWWFYVEKHNVQLPDEYDQIHQDLEPFWGMDPKDLNQMVSEWEDHPDTFTLGGEDNKVLVVNYSLPDNDQQRARHLATAFYMMEILEDVQKYIPPFRAVFSVHDNPNLPTDHELKTMALKAAAAGKYIDIKKPPPVKLDGWIAACPPNSPAWRTPINITEPAPPITKLTKKTFIYNHRLAMDPCVHQTLLIQHGQYLSHKKGPVPHRVMIPQFSYSPSPLHHDIGVANPSGWVDDVEGDLEWEEKVDERLLWRGKSTGMWHAKGTRWRESQRGRLVAWAGEMTGNVTVLKVGEKGEKGRVGEGVEVKNARINPGTLDVAFVGPDPYSCAEETCAELKEIFEWRKWMDSNEAWRYKYILDVDGNAWSSRFKRLITSRSLIFKSTIYPEWFTDRIAPWVHYIPVKVDLSDVHDTLTFFRGDLNGEGAHDELARKIALAGREWSRTFWRKEDSAAYLFRLLLEYARVMSPDRGKMTYKELEGMW